MKKYSNVFERDWKCYSNPFIQEEFEFSGKPDSEFLAKIKSDPKGKTAKECFHAFDSTGKIISCCEPEELLKIFKAKAGINFQIKQWAKMFSDGLLFPQELVEIEKEYDFPLWVKEAVIRQSGRPCEIAQWHKEYILSLVLATKDKKQ